MPSGNHPHGRFNVKTFASGGRVRASVFSGDTWLRDIPDFVGESEGEALDKARAAVDTLKAERAKVRGGTSFPSAEEYREALLALQPTENRKPRWRMLLTLAASPAAMTATEIAASQGYDGFQPSNSQLGALAHLIADLLRIDVDKRRDGSSIWTLAVATEERTGTNEAEWRWQIRPEVAEALSSMKEIVLSTA